MNKDQTHLPLDDPLLKRTFSEEIIVDRSEGAPLPRSSWDHYHDYYEIYVNLSGNMRYFIDDGIYELERHDIALIDHFSIHRSIYPEGILRDRLLIMFSPRLFQGALKEAASAFVGMLFHERVLRPETSDWIELWKQLTTLQAIYEDREDPHRDFHLLHQLATLLVLLSQQRREHPGGNDGQRQSSRHLLVEKIIRYIDHNYAADITLEAMADALYANQFYLCHVFKEITGITIFDFITVRRLKEAVLMLSSSDRSLDYIAASVGYSNKSYFIRKFKQKYGITPHQYRKQLRQLNP